MKIQVIGRICPDCDKVFEMTKQTLTTLNIVNDIERVTETREIIKHFGMVHIPAVAVDGKVLFSGEIPNEEKMKKLFSRYRN
ncbi:MAG TPA: thioredoxin family protein [Aminobacterium sp.]|jgi:small redox-active disulfide protein 2|uniref:thioredoxin family protein n=1 Tax=Aminobacterium TaxID=81466 RepID=UPI0004676C30|nr:MULTISPECIES: thioredoxin family protein [Aminobacterium]HCA40398.1 thioredoxin family protein [Aminobacterium sp.]